ncbi:TPA: UPF0182 family protein [Candidatus Poribacteria bacterium]|nr:UPF0182 family protein [Candidatus Poribacteria bacterium]
MVYLNRTGDKNFMEEIKMKGPLRKIVAIILILIAVWILGRLIISVYPEYLWFKHLNYASVFTRIFWTKVAMGVTATVLLLGLTLGNLYLIWRFSTTLSPAIIDAMPLGRPDFDLRKYIFVALSILSIFFSLILGYSTASHWEVVLRYFNSDGIKFNLIDPIFHKDVGFYIFKMPFLRYIYGWIFGIFLLITIATVVVYFFHGQILDRRNRFAPPFRVKAHIFTLMAITLFSRAWGYRFLMYDLLYSTRGRVLGAGYADVYARKPVLWILMFLCIAAGVIFFISIFMRRTRYAIGSLVLIFIVAFLGGIWPATVQKFKVKPNELNLERPFIGYNIKFTRYAYNLDRIEEREYPVIGRLTYDVVTSNKAFMENVRLWDWRPLKQIFKQLQVLRPQYDFSDVDIDRYRIGGRLRQVMLAARELNYNQLRAEAKTWVNRTFTYTHGYGVCVVPVSEIINGRPRFYVKDIPLDYAPEWPERIRENPGPRIYYGEMTDHYVIVNPQSAQPREFDYPMEESEQYVKNSYQGKGGVPISSMIRKLIFAWKFRSINMLLSGEIERTSRILFHRNIQDRISTIAPFLRFDQDPYIVMANGRLYWIIDAYTVTHRFPYSEPMEDVFKEMVRSKFGRKTARRVLRTRGEPWGNYIRNSVKIVVDAYDGTVDFYVVDEANDPMIQCYMRMFPDMFKPFESMPLELKAHVRYPMALFLIQALKYRSYHMTSPDVFYAREDLWEIGYEIYDNTAIQGEQQQQVSPLSRFTGVRVQQSGRGNVQPVEPYYLIVTLPDEGKSEFLIMIPYTPAGKANLTAWLAARCDIPNYGRLMVYKFPKGQLVNGPMQVESFISQNPDISKDLSLWDMRGSRVLRGNLLIIPMSGSVLYVEPIYIQAEQSEDAIPELSRVVIGYKQSERMSVVMGTTLEDALRRMFVGGAISQAPPPAGVEVNVKMEELSFGQSPTADQLIRLAKRHYDMAQEAIKRGDWAEYGNQIKKLGEVLSQLKTASGGGR